MLHHFAVNLHQGLRLACLRAPRPQPGLAQLLGLLVCGWGFALLADWDWRYAPEALTLSSWGIATEAARGYWWLGAVALLSVAARGRLPFLALATSLAAADLVVWSAWFATVTLWPLIDAPGFAQAGQRLWQIALAWQVAIFARAVFALGNLSAHRGFALSALYAGALWVNIDVLPDTPLFDPPEEAAPPPLDVESTYTRQPPLLTRELARVAPGTHGVSEMFVLVFAGYGEEDVFMREALSAGRILAQRYRAQSRIVRLINNRRTLAHKPLANRSNLQAALHGIAARMQRDEDILFLFLTSHGAESGEFSVELGELGLNALRPPALRAALDAAGIRWRVVVVSACYSGQFIDALEGPETLLITAAAADRQSFGCAHENDWTYFGEAFFRDALADARSLIEAFERARLRIAARERREHKPPSRPQMRAGADILPVLGRLDKPPSR